MANPATGSSHIIHKFASRVFSAQCSDVRKKADALPTVMPIINDIMSHLITKRVPGYF
jgi:hypothetical protein